MLKRTALFQAHQKAGGRLIEFGGWEMPVQYTSILDEHQAVRTAAGIFDISHMGEVFVGGKGAAGFLNRLLTNDIRKIAPGQAQYTLMCNERGGVVDDLYAYCLGVEEYLLIINASRIDPDVNWMREQRSFFGFDVAPSDCSGDLAAVAVQGPSVRGFIGAVADPAAATLKKNQVLVGTFGGQKIYVACTGYTGEDGFEIVAPNGAVEEIWNRCLEVGGSHGIKPAGLGARDTLRTEMCYPLYGHELNENTTPIEAGLAYFVDFDKGPFTGREALLQQKQAGSHRTCVAFTMAPKSPPPRPDYRILSAEGEEIGQVTSGTQSPSLGMGIGLGYVRNAWGKPGMGIEIEIRGRRFPAQVVRKPIYKKPV